jgi:hypothetical protein
MPPSALWLGLRKGFALFFTPLPWAALTHRFFVAGTRGRQAIGHGAITDLLTRLMFDVDDDRNLGA